MKLKCLIAEAEPIAREILRSYIEKTPGLIVAAQFPNAIQALEYLQAHAIDLLFLDIKMPQMTGIELLERITNKPKTIITSAFRYYATDAFDLEVVDYLLKPYSYQRFQKAIRKAGAETMGDQAEPVKEAPSFFIKGNKQLHRIAFEDIIFVESQRDYVKFRLIDGTDLFTRNTISYYEEFLPSSHFVRVHRSFIVALSKVTSVEATSIHIAGFEIPVGRNYKSYLTSRLPGQIG